MAVPEQTPYNIYTANGVTTVFPYEFYLLQSDDLAVYIDGEQISTGFTVSGVGIVNGGEVTFLTPPAAGGIIMLERVIPATRTTEYQNNGDLLAGTVNKDFDRLWMAIKQAFVNFGFVLTRPISGGPFNAHGFRIENLGDPINNQDGTTKLWVNTNLNKTLRVPESFIPAIPSIEHRKNKVLAFDDSGNPIAVIPESGTATDVLIELAKPTGSFRIGYDREQFYSGTVGDYLDKSIGYVTPEMFGAAGDGVTDDRAAIQAAIDFAANSYTATGAVAGVYLTQNYLVSLNPASTLIPGEVAAGRGALCIKPRVHLFGHGGITLDKGFTGTSSGAVITNWQGAADNCSVRDITIDGGYGAAPGSGINGINIVDSDDVVINGVNIKNSTAGGIYLRRSGSSLSDHGCSNARVINCYVDNVHYIGIQLERPNGALVHGNTVINSGDNGIDVEGNNSATTGIGLAAMLTIANNNLRDNKHGIFMESCGNALITGNNIDLARSVGIIGNRINSNASRISITANYIRGVDAESARGIRLINQVGAYHIGDNVFMDLYASIRCSTVINNLTIGANTHTGITKFLLELDRQASALIRSRIYEQSFLGTQASGFPTLFSPRNCPSNYPNRLAGSVKFDEANFSYLANSGENNFTRATAVIVRNTSWAAYARFNNTVDGYTDLNGHFGNIGEYLTINGNTYQVYATSENTTTITKWDGSAYASGNFVSDFDDAYTVETKRSEWGSL
ncbi:phage tail fiber domain-containing protein [Brenneria tiliae]|uniref:phage tail fiber domain-containing protein n=1 Tax=Brenneria tiliae TaxID=2914984 RepID=UPI0020149019|nr:phage tail fiber protein [Brenneria tiliae]MCL2899790.1 right-handed parallel beta-helix repeat-containing protein [Brenneria tiliae]MCL2904721.1 right-handed parallel beta-helix repeat-containing protein [Brenneria tiliae]